MLMDENYQRMYHAMFGNGREGLVEKVPRLEEKLKRLENLEETVKSIQTDVKILLMFKAQESGKAELRSDYNKDKKWIVTSLISLAALMLTAIGLFVL